MAKLRLFVAEGCAPCQEVKDLLHAGKVELDGVDPAAEREVIDVTTEEGYALIDEFSLDGVPAAYLDRQRCDILKDEESGAVRISCPSTT